MSHKCPVCAYPDLAAPPIDFEICPCCGTEFGLDDDQKDHDELRSDWIARDMRWFSRANRPPLGWNPARQLLEAGHMNVVPRAAASNVSTRPERVGHTVIVAYAS